MAKQSAQMEFGLANITITKLLKLKIFATKLILLYPPMAKHGIELVIHQINIQT